MAAHEVPRRTFDSLSTTSALPPARRERYPFHEDVLRTWEQRALEVDATISSEEPDRAS